MGALNTLSFILFWRSHIDWALQQCFWNIGHSPIEAPLWTPVTKQLQMCSPMTHLCSLYTWELNFGQTICDKSEVLLQKYWGITWEPHGNMTGTHWEQGGKNNNVPSSPPPKEGYWISRECMLNLPLGCMKLLFPKMFVTIFHVDY